MGDLFGSSGLDAWKLVARSCIALHAALDGPGEDRADLLTRAAELYESGDDLGRGSAWIGLRISMSDDSAEKQFERLRPDRVDSPGQIQDFLDRFVRDIVRAPTHESSRLRLEEDRSIGWVHYPAALEALRILWGQTPFSSYPIDVTVLPTIRMGSEGALFASSAARMVGKGEPNAEDPVVHIWEAGSSIRPLHRHWGFVLCQSETGYLGWVTEKEFDVQNESAVSSERGTPRIDLERLEEIAFPWLGTPYVWGGGGGSGIDCSAFSQWVYKELGFSLPRDANQQMLAGRLVSTHDQRFPLEPGDLLCFTSQDGRIGHVAVSLGGWKAIHAERPEVCLLSLNEKDSEFNEERCRGFAFAKRYFI